MHIYICTDGNKRMGLGHIYRTITLARELSQTVTFLTCSDQDVLDKIRDGGFEAVHVQDETEMLAALGQRPRGVVILDRLEIDPQFASGVRRVGHSLVIFGNLSGANDHAQLVVNIVGSDFRNSRNVDARTGTMYLRGPRYYIFKRSFFQCRAEMLSPQEGRLLVMFGGTDPLDLTTQTYRLLSSKEGIAHLDLVVGAGYEHFHELAEEMRPAACGPEVRLQRDVEDIASLMAKASLVITSPGMSMFEALFMRRPVLAIAQVPYHDEQFGKDFILHRPQDLPALLEGLDPGMYNNPDDESIRSMEIGEGKDEIVRAISELEA